MRWQFTCFFLSATLAVNHCSLGCGRSRPTIHTCFICAQFWWPTEGRCIYSSAQMYNMISKWVCSKFQSFPVPLNTKSLFKNNLFISNCECFFFRGDCLHSLYTLHNVSLNSLHYFYTFFLKKKKNQSVSKQRIFRQIIVANWKSFSSIISYNVHEDLIEYYFLEVKWF